MIQGKILLLYVLVFRQGSHLEGTRRPLCQHQIINCGIVDSVVAWSLTLTKIIK